MTCNEANELISTFIDNEVSDLERQAIASHLQRCSRCQAIYQQEQELKRSLRSLGARIVVPAGLKEKILADLRTFPRPGKASWNWIWSLWPAGMGVRPAFALALLFLLLVPVFYFIRPASEFIPLAALEVHAKIDGGEFSFVRNETEQAAVTRLARSVGGRFAPMGFDLSAAGLKLAGGLVHELANREALVAVYRGSAPAVTCFTLLGNEPDAPPQARLVVDPGTKTNYYTFTDGTSNGVMHHVDGRICLLVSKMPMDRLLDLARFVRYPVQS